MSTSRISHYAEQLRPLVSLPGLFLFLISVLFYLAYADTFAQLEYYWVEGYNWQFLIPIALIYMLWERRDIFYRLDYRPSLTIGTLLLLGCGALLIAGQVSSTHAVRELAMIGTFFALSVLLLGIRSTRTLFWPLAYLILMTSLPTEALEKLREPLKLVSATVSTEVLQFFGYAVYREGSFLYLPHITLEVADECSGVNQLTSSIALGIPIAFTILNKWWKRLFIILVSAAFGIIMNWVRVILISLWHYDSAKASIHGPQDIYGLPFIFLVGIFITLVIAFSIAGKQPGGMAAHKADRGHPLQQLFSAKGFKPAALSGIVVLAAVALYLDTWQAQAIEPSKPLATFPQEVAGYRGQPLEALQKPFYSGLADDEAIIRYRSDDDTATIYIGYFRSQDQERELVDYRYNWLHQGAAPITVSIDGRPLKMKRRLVKNRQKTQTVFFTYDINGRNIIDLKQAKLASLIDAIARHRNNGGIIMLIFEGDKTTLSPSEQRFLQAAVDHAWNILP